MKKNSKAGFILSAELVMIATILVIGLLVGLVTIRNQMIAELKDTANAIGAVDQSFAFTGTQQLLQNGGTAETLGSQWTDAVDTYAGDNVAPSVLLPAPVNEAMPAVDVLPAAP